MTARADGSVSEVRIHGRYSTYTAGCHCAKCREASRAWMAQFRSEGGSDASRLGTRARNAAKEDLARLYPEEFRRLYNARRARLGLEPVGAHRARQQRGGST